MNQTNSEQNKDASPVSISEINSETRNVSNSIINLDHGNETMNLSIDSNVYIQSITNRKRKRKTSIESKKLQRIEKENPKKQSTKSNSKKKKRINQNEGKQHGRAKDRKESREETMRQALEVSWDENYVPDESVSLLDIQDPEEYLRRVRYEAKQLPDVFIMKEVTNISEDTSQGTRLEMDQVSSTNLHYKQDVQTAIVNTIEEEELQNQYSPNTREYIHFQSRDDKSQSTLPGPWMVLQSLYKKSEEVKIIPQNRMPFQELEHHINRFTLYRKMIEKARINWRRNQCEIDDSFECPPPLDWNAWKLYILEKKQAPVAQVLLAMEYNEFVQLLSKCILWSKMTRKKFETINRRQNEENLGGLQITDETITVEVAESVETVNTHTEISKENTLNMDSVSKEITIALRNESSDKLNLHILIQEIKHIFFWIYTLYAHLEDPISASTQATLGEYTKWLVEWRGMITSEFHSLLPQFHTLIAIGVNYFQQGKIEWV